MERDRGMWTERNRGRVRGTERGEKGERKEDVERVRRRQG